jgi:hypothetical protein
MLTITLLLLAAKLHFETIPRLRLCPVLCECLRRCRSGDLVVGSRYGAVRHRRPFNYQNGEGRKLPVSGNFEIRADAEIGFRIRVYERTGLTHVQDNGSAISVS